MLRYFGLLAVGLALGVSGGGCFFGDLDGGTSDSDVSPPPDDENPPTPPTPDDENPEALDRCTTGLSDGDISRDLHIAWALHDSIHELVACGAMTSLAVQAVVTGLAEAVLSQSTSFEPKGLAYHGDGRYTSQTGSGGAQAELELSFFHAVDGELVPIQENLYDLDTYLAGATVSAGLDGLTPWALITFDGPGPWVELLGMGDNPTSPIYLEGNELLAWQPDVSGVWVESKMDVHDTLADSVIEYQAVSTRQPVGTVFTTGLLDYELVDIEATNDARGQTAIVDELAWDIGFGANSLTGSTSFEINGGLFDYTLFYGHSADHSDEIVYACAD
jgi:hypothetical protein